MIERMIPTDRGTFAVREYGVGGPLVVGVHGFPDDASTFDALAADLSGSGLRFASISLRGYSPSELRGSLALDDLVRDLEAVIALLGEGSAVHLVAHDYGAQLSYPLLSRHPDLVASAVLLAGAHPAFVVRNARRSLRQVWMSRYILFFQLGRLADRAVSRHDFAAVRRLWRRWSPGWTPPPAHLDHVIATMRASMPAPVKMYREGGFSPSVETISVPVLLIQGDRDGCALPMLADGQEAAFAGEYRRDVWSGCGHFPHLEYPERSATAVREWVDQHPITERNAD